MIPASFNTFLTISGVEVSPDRGQGVKFWVSSSRIKILPAGIFPIFRVLKLHIIRRNYPKEDILTLSEHKCVLDRFSRQSQFLNIIGNRN